MKRILFIFLFFQYSISFAQKDSTKRKLDIYGSFYGLIDVKYAKPGAGIYFGVRPISIAGLGLGFEMLQIPSLNSTSKMGLNTYGEFRVFMKYPIVIPSLAFQYGLFNYSDVLNLSGGGSSSTIKIKGKQVVGGNINFCLTSKPSGKGFSIGYSYKSITIESTDNLIYIQIINGVPHAQQTSNTVMTSSVYHIISAGYNF